MFTNTNDEEIAQDAIDRFLNKYKGHEFLCVLQDEFKLSTIDAIHTLQLWNKNFKDSEANK